MDAIWQQRKVEATTYFENLMQKLQELEEVFRTTVNEEPKRNTDLYFSDGIRKIDYIFVYKRDNNKKNAKEIVNNYIKNLEKEGVQFEVGESDLHPELLFIKVHVLRSRLIMCSVLLNYEPGFMQIPDAPVREIRIINIPYMNTDLHRQELLSDVVQRASESSLGARPKDLTGAERIMITFEILKNVNFGTKRYEMGLEHLLNKKYLESAYPLHDQPGHWSDTGYLNDRQLLRKYWAKFSMALKYQPLEVINKYFGSEVAFYFAFLGFYNRMLIPVAILGTLAFAYGVVTKNTDANPFSLSICNSDKTFCPTCQNHRLCKFQPVASYCNKSKVHYLFDNKITLVYAIIMCFWATIVTELWKRQETVLKYKWNLLNLEQDRRPRPEYSMKVTHKRFNKSTGKYDYYIPEKIHALKVIISCILCGFLAVLVLVMVLGAILLRLSIIYMINTMKYKLIEENIQLISQLISTGMLFIFMMIFDVIYKYFATKLTDFECPRTQAQYDKSFLLKLHVLSMINAYACLYYSAFFKGAFISYPGEEHEYESLGILNNDANPMSPMLHLSFQLIFIFTGKTVFMMICEFLLPILQIKWRKRKALKLSKKKNDVYRSWEKDYHRNKIGYYDVTVKEFKTVMIQYGYLILFPAVFPLGPLLALIANIIELRIDAYKLIRCTRRPVPMRVPGIGGWLSILCTLSYIGIITNCFLIAFTTNFLFYVKMYYFHENIDMLNVTFSVFDVKDYPKSSDFYGTKEVTECLYKGRRFSPYHSRRYEYNSEYWFIMCNQLLIVILLEGIVLGFNKLLSFAIPDMPHQIKERVHLRQLREKTAREKRLNEKFHAEHRIKTSVTKEQLTRKLSEL